MICEIGMTNIRVVSDPFPKYFSPTFILENRTHRALLTGAADNSTVPNFKNHRAGLSPHRLAGALITPKPDGKRP